MTKYLIYIFAIIGFCKILSYILFSFLYKFFYGFLKEVTKEKPEYLKRFFIFVYIIATMFFSNYILKN